LGAGHLNVGSALKQYRAGEWEQGVVPNIGWDYGTIGGAGSFNIYVFNRPLFPGEVVAATLCWDRRVETISPNQNDHTFGFFDYQDLSQVLNDMDIYLMLEGGDPTNIEDIIWGSVSAVDNVEHVFFSVPFAGFWQIVVANTEFGLGDGENYGLAWWAGDSISGDFDGDGDVDKDDLPIWKTGFDTSEADADDDGDTDGADFLAWQRNLGLNVPAATAVPEPAAALLGCMGLPLLWLRRRAAALCAAVGVVAVAQPASAAEMTLNRQSRPITAAEAAGGAPAGGMVHDFRVTSDSDLLSLLAEINVPVYQHPYGNDHSEPHPQLVAAYPALGANSFLQFPSGSTLVLGGGFTGAGPERVWGDVNNDGPQTNFLFGRLTTTQVGTFSGHFAVRGATTYVEMPFSLALPGPSGPLSETLPVFGTEQSFAPPTIPTLPDLSANAPTPGPGPSSPVSSPAFDPFASAPPSDADIPVSVALTRRSRPVAGDEIAAGAPAGYVHEFFITSTTDVIGIRDVDLDVPVYQHKFGADYRPPSAKGLALFRGLSADSFLDTPGQTDVLGGYADPLGNPETVWYDRNNNGAQDEFLFARLTVGETGHFSGTLNVAGPTGPVGLGFKFVLPGTADDLALLDQEPPFSLDFSLDAPPASISQIPEPAAWLLGVLGLPLLTRRRGRLH